MGQLWRESRTASAILAGSLAALAPVAAATPSAARTAEELVAFLYAGIEDGAVVNRHRAARESASPATFRLVSTENPAQVEILTVEKKSDCRYALSQRELGRDDRPPLKATLDFSKVAGVDFGTRFGDGLARSWTGAVAGFCTTDENVRHCDVFTRPSLSLPPAATRERMLSAMDEMRTQVCKTDKS